jgi:phosphoribosylformylglycinamidine synthase
MSLAVPPHSIDAFLRLARLRDVEAAVVGEFTDTGLVEVFAHGKLVGMLSLDFLHGGLPVMQLRAEWTPPAARPAARPRDELQVDDLRAMMLDLVGDPNIRSREEWVRCYDHEVQARSVVKPFVGRRRDGPSDGAVIIVRHDSVRGITVTHGFCPRYGDHDTYHMAQCAVDEAVRAHVSLGGDPEQMAALDNFCWPDPVEGPGNPDGAHKLAQLVRACRGLAEACRAYMLPLISGKDSMKNDARVGGRKISVRPTLLVSVIGIIGDVHKAQTTDFKDPGDLIYIVGETRGELGGTCIERRTQKHFGPCPSVDLPGAWTLYRRLHSALRRGFVRSCHDLSDGGLWAALAECCLGGDRGARISLDPVPVSGMLGNDAARILFCETPSRFLVSVAPARRARWERAMAGARCGLLGEVTAERDVRIEAAGARLASISVDDIRAAWSGEGTAT